MAKLPQGQVKIQVPQGLIKLSPIFPQGGGGFHALGSTLRNIQINRTNFLFGENDTNLHIIFSKGGLGKATKLELFFQPQTMNYVADVFDEKMSGTNLKLIHRNVSQNSPTYGIEYMGINKLIAIKTN